MERGGILAGAALGLIMVTGSQDFLKEEYDGRRFFPLDFKYDGNDRPRENHRYYDKTGRKLARSKKSAKAVAKRKAAKAARKKNR